MNPMLSILYRNLNNAPDLLDPGTNRILCHLCGQSGWFVFDHPMGLLNRISVGEPSFIWRALIAPGIFLMILGALIFFKQVIFMKMGPVLSSDRDFIKAIAWTTFSFILFIVGAELVIGGL